MKENYLQKLLESLNNTEIICEGKTYGNAKDDKALHEVVKQFLKVRENRNQVFFIGNGGSAAIASHMTTDYLKNGRLRTNSLYDSSVLTCISNDYGYENVFSEPLSRLANEGDLLVAISSSGNSENIVKAILQAASLHLKVITFSGFRRDNKIVSMGDYNIYVPICHYGIVESIHNLLLQEIVDLLME